MLKFIIIKEKTNESELIKIIKSSVLIYHSFKYKTWFSKKSAYRFIYIKEIHRDLYRICIKFYI